MVMKQIDKRPKSKILATVYKTAADLHSAGAIDTGKMRKYDLLTNNKNKPSR